MTDGVIEFDAVDTDVDNVIDNAGVVDSRLYSIPETEVVLGYHVNDEPITTTMDHVAVMAIDRELDDAERAQMPDGKDRLTFVTVLLAGEDGQAAEETIVNVRETRDVEYAKEAFELVYDDGVVDLEASLKGRDFVVEDGELVDNSVSGEDE